MTTSEREWLDRASRLGGSFVKSFAMSCFCADDANFAILRPTLAVLMRKYPSYLPDGTLAEEQA